MSDTAARSSALHRVAVLADDTVMTFELASVVHVLRVVEAVDGARYEVAIVGPDRPVASAAGRATSFAVVPEQSWPWAALADTVVVPGHPSFLDVVPGEILDVVKEARARGARLISLGLGAFALASAGVLDDLVATTHWRWAGELAARYPRVCVDRDKLYVSDQTGGSLHTAGGAAGVVDLVLHLVELDHGAWVAGDIANQVVAPPRRAGEQAQYLDHSTPIEREPVLRTMRWAEERLTTELTVSDLARHTHMSTRHFARRFRAITGGTPLDWLLRARIRRAQYLLETTSWSIERVGHESGFGAPGTFRHHFARVVGTTPSRYRRSRQDGTPVERCA